MKRRALWRLVPFVILALTLSPRASADTPEIDAAVSFGDATGQPGEVVEVPVRANLPFPAGNWFFVFLFDPDQLDLLGYDPAGSDAGHADPTSVVWRTFDPEQGSFGVLNHRNSNLAFRVASGDGRLLGLVRFRIRATASAGSTSVTPVDRLEGTHISASMIEFDTGAFSLEERRPRPLQGATITIRPPAGPRPVGDLACEQFLDRAVLTFTPSEAYDEIEVLRDGETIARLAGDAAGHADPIPHHGSLRYSVVAHRGGASSIAVACELLATAAVAPPVEELTCEDATLAWRSPQPFDSIHILRAGEPIAVLPGDATGYRDDDRPEGLTLYSVVTELEGFRSPDVHCLHNGIWAFEVGDVRARPGDTEVEVPLYATTPQVSVNFDAHLEVDTSVFTIVVDEARGIAGTQTHPEPEVYRMGMGVYGLPAVGIIYDQFSPIEPEKNLQPGLRQLIFRFVLKASRPLEAGEVFPTTLRAGSFGIIPPGRGVMSAHPDVIVGGEIRVGSAGPAAVADLEAKVAAGGGGGAAAGGAGGDAVSLAWRNTALYDAVRVSRNGEVLAELPGDAKSFLDPGVARGIYTYKVSGVRGAATSFPASAFLSTFEPRGAFRRGDANSSGRIDIVDPISTLRFLFNGGGAPACEDAADADDDGTLTINDPVLTLHFLFLGDRVLPAPGTAHAWFDPTPDSLGCEG